MEVGFGRGVGRKGNGMMRERMKTEEKMRWNTMTLEFESRPCNESFARVSAAAFLAQLNPTVEEVADVKTAISEAVTNAMIHGYRQEKGKIQMKCVLDLEEKVFQVTVKDTGVGIENVDPLLLLFQKACERLCRKNNIQHLFLSRFQFFCLFISDQTTKFFSASILRKRSINLHNFFSAVCCSCVFYLNSYCHTFRSSIYTAKSNIKFCIRQTITK